MQSFASRLIISTLNFKITGVISHASDRIVCIQAQITDVPKFDPTYKGWWHTLQCAFFWAVYLYVILLPENNVILIVNIKTRFRCITVALSENLSWQSLKLYLQSIQTNRLIHSDTLYLHYHLLFDITFPKSANLNNNCTIIYITIFKRGQIFANLCIIDWLLGQSTSIYM